MNERTSIPDALWSLPRSWKEAERAGAKLYFTGKPCPKCGNVDARRYPKGKCVTCERDENRARDQRKREERAAALAAEQTAKEEARLARMAEEGTEVVLAKEEAERLAAEEARREKANARSRKRRLERMAEIGTEVVRKEEADSTKKAYWADPEKHRARITVRRAEGKVGHRYEVTKTPPWLTEEERGEIKRIYATCPLGWHVDHIVPRDDHPDLVGLHVPWNLQHLPPPQDNQRRRGCVNEFRCTAAEAADYVSRGMAVWKRDVAPDGTINWERYPRPMDR